MPLSQAALFGMQMTPLFLLPQLDQVSIEFPLQVVFKKSL
jgi:hypothetical protein